MAVYFNEESDSDYLAQRAERGRPERYLEFIDEVTGLEPLGIEPGGKGPVELLEDGRSYAVVGTRENPFTEVRIDAGIYDEEAFELVEASYVEQEHLQEMGVVLRTDSREPIGLQEIMDRKHEEGWNIRVVEADELELDQLRPFH